MIDKSSSQKFSLLLFIDERILYISPRDAKAKMNPAINGISSRMILPINLGNSQGIWEKKIFLFER